MKWTEEQEAILNSDGDIIVNAVAGSGKSSTLVEYCRRRPQEKMLYLVFNRSAKLDAQQKFRDAGVSNVDIHTAHSLAYRHVVIPHAYRVKNNYSVYDIKNILNLKGTGFHGYMIASHISKYSEAYFNSTYFKPKDMNYRDIIPTPKGREFFDANKDDILLGVEVFIEQMHEGVIDVNHSFYLKGFQLSQPQLKYDCILYDEFQDSNPVMIDIFTKQECRKVCVGDNSQQIYCQPEGTMVATPSNTKTISVINKPIEDLNVGDNVMTYHNSSLFKTGRKISSISKFYYSGMMTNISIPSKDFHTRCTDKHHCIVRFDMEKLKNKHIVYMMRQDDNFRIGKTKYIYYKQNNCFGLILRGKAENADCSWILSVHDDEHDALLHEHMYQNMFNIPSYRFVASENSRIAPELFWESIPPTIDNAKQCLIHFNLLLDFPFWKKGQRMGLRIPFITASANIHDGMLMLPLGNEVQYRNKRDYKAPRHTWEPITIIREYYTGDVYSIEVDDHHTYFGDNILTHNSWRGAVNALEKVEFQQFSLTTSFRFTQRIANIAKRCLDMKTLFASDYDSPQMKGFKESSNDEARPIAVLARTNLSLLNDAISTLQDDGDAKIYFEGNLNSYTFMSGINIYDVFNLNYGNKKYIKNPLIKTMNSFSELEQYIDKTGDGDLNMLVKIVKKYGRSLPDYFKRLKDRCLNDTNKHLADVIFTTVHKSKGLEYNNVKILDDFINEEQIQTELDGKESGKINRDKMSEEVNILYVALTRTKNDIILPERLEYLNE